MCQVCQVAKCMNIFQIFWPSPTRQMRCHDLAAPCVTFKGREAERMGCQPWYTNPDAPWCWNIHLQNWAIFRVNVGIDIPAPWSIWAMDGPTDLVGISSSRLAGDFTKCLVAVPQCSPARKLHIFCPGCVRKSSGLVKWCSNWMSAVVHSENSTTINHDI